MPCLMDSSFVDFPGIWIVLSLYIPVWRMYLHFHDYICTHILVHLNHHCIMGFYFYSKTNTWQNIYYYDMKNSAIGNLNVFWLSDKQYSLTYSLKNGFPKWATLTWYWKKIHCHPLEIWLMEPDARARAMGNNPSLLGTKQEGESETV